MILQRVSYHKTIKVNDATENYILNEIKEINEILNKEKDLPKHDHNELYFTQEQINNLLTGKSGTDHNHDGTYYNKKQVVEVVNGLINQNQAEDEIVISQTRPSSYPKLWFKVIE